MEGHVRPAQESHKAQEAVRTDRVKGLSTKKSMKSFSVPP